MRQIRGHWPKTRIHIRGDSGFCRESIMRWCEDNPVDHVPGLARNPRLVRAGASGMEAARAAHNHTGKSARRYRDLRCRTHKSWSRSRRVVGKAEVLGKGDNPRFVVTGLAPRQAAAKRLYEQLYCARGDMENRIKEQQLDLFADRTGSHTMRANRLRLYFASTVNRILRLCADAVDSTTGRPRHRPGSCAVLHPATEAVEGGARVRITARRVWVSFSESWPYAGIFTSVPGDLHAEPVRSPPG